MHPDKDTVDWEAVAKQFQSENETWRAQWKGFQYHQQSHWTVHIRKPDMLLMPLRGLAAYLKTIEPHKLYIYTLIVCTIAGTLAEIIALYVRDSSHE